jgi:hypothetical protein
MSYLVNYRERIKPNVVVRVKRVLEGTGKITAFKGEEVQPFDILGHSQVSAGFSTIKLASLLKVPKKEVIKYLQKPIGSKIFKGELLAYKKGLFGSYGEKAVLSPTDSIIEVYDERTGNLRLKMLPKDIPLLAGVFGVVENISAKGEVWIKTHGTEIRGVIGSGKERHGLLHVIAKEDALITRSQIKEEYHNGILVCGALIFPDALREAINKSVSGMICGGMNARDFRSLGAHVDPMRRLGTDVGISLMLTEGFGAITLGEDIMDLFKFHEGQFVFMNGNASRLLLPSQSADSIITIRKTVLPSTNLPETQPQVRSVELHQGDAVRLIWAPFMGAQGKVTAIDENPTLLPSGITTHLVTVETKFKKLRVPFANLEKI